jgi:hypothetical protein
MTDDEKPVPKGSPWLKELYDLFAPVRQSFIDDGMTEDEINAEIDEAIREARAERRLDPRSDKEIMRAWLNEVGASPETARRFGVNR